MADFRVNERGRQVCCLHTWGWLQGFGIVPCLHESELRYPLASCLVFESQPVWRGQLDWASLGYNRQRKPLALNVVPDLFGPNLLLVASFDLTVYNKISLKLAPLVTWDKQHRGRERIEESNRKMCVFCWDLQLLILIFKIASISEFLRKRWLI
jgi:hypothetical protein